MPFQLIRLLALSLLLLAGVTTVQAADAKQAKQDKFPRVAMPVHEAVGEVEHWKVLWPNSDKMINEEIIYFDQHSILRTFDPKGRLLEEREYEVAQKLHRFTRYNQQDGSIIEEEIYQRGELHKRTAWTTDAKTGIVTITDVYVYPGFKPGKKAVIPPDASKNEISHRIVYWGANADARVNTDTVIYKDGRKIVRTHTDKLLFEDEFVPIENFPGEYERKRCTDFDENGKPTMECLYGTGGDKRNLIKRTTWTYDDNGQVIRTKVEVDNLD